MRTITVETQNGSKRMRVPDDALRDAQCTYANQVDTGVYETDRWVSPRGRVILRMNSRWDNGHGCATGDYYVLLEDKIRLAEEFGIEDEAAVVEA